MSYMTPKITQKIEDMMTRLVYLKNNKLWYSPEATELLKSVVDVVVKHNRDAIELICCQLSSIYRSYCILLEAVNNIKGTGFRFVLSYSVTNHYGLQAKGLYKLKADHSVKTLDFLNQIEREFNPKKPVRLIQTQDIIWD